MRLAVARQVNTLVHASGLVHTSFLPPLSLTLSFQRPFDPSGGHQRIHTSRSVWPQLPSPPHASLRPPAYVWPCWQ